MLHLFSLAKSHLIFSEPKKPFSLTLVWIFSQPLLTWCDLRASLKIACCSNTHITTLTLVGMWLLPNNRYNPFVNAQPASSHLEQILPKFKMAIILKNSVMGN